MKAYYRIVDEQTKLVEFGIGTNTDFYESIGMVVGEIEKSDKDGRYYLAGYTPMKTVDELINEEKEQVGKLTMTALDLVSSVKSLGLTANDIEDYLNSNIELKQQLTYCKDVFCDVVRQLCPIVIKDITITEEYIVNLFKLKNNI